VVNHDQDDLGRSEPGIFQVIADAAVQWIALSATCGQRVIMNLGAVSVYRVRARVILRQQQRPMAWTWLLPVGYELPQRWQRLERARSDANCWCLSGSQGDVQGLPSRPQFGTQGRRLAQPAGTEWREGSRRPSSRPGHCQEQLTALRPSQGVVATLDRPGAVGINVKRLMC